MKRGPRAAFFLYRLFMLLGKKWEENCRCFPWYNRCMYPRPHLSLLALLITHYGYAILFFGTFFEGETILALAGFAAYEGHLKLGLIIPIAIAGALLGDQFFFYLGRYKGKQLLARYPTLGQRVERVHQLTAHYHGWIIFGSRFMYGFRVIIPLSFGAGGISALRFFLLDLLGAIVWAPIFALGGYAFGNAVQHFLGNVKKFEEIIILGVIIIAVVLQTTLVWRRKQKIK